MLCGTPVTPFWIVNAPVSGATEGTYEVFTGADTVPFQVTVNKATGKVSEVDCGSGTSV